MIVLDTNILSYLCHIADKPEFAEPKRWLEQLRYRGIEVAIPEIADYELRRSLIRINSARSIATLDELELFLSYIPITTTTMRRAASLWAEARLRGQATAPDAALDGDVILASQVLELSSVARPVIVATTNIRHLRWFVDARLWIDIVADSPELEGHLQ